MLQKQDQNPIPSEGTTFKTPNGIDQCPACGTAGLFVEKDPNKCLCGAVLTGLSETTITSTPDRGERDVIIRSDDKTLRHKVFDYCDGTDIGNNPRRSLVYWRVNGTPRRTGPGRSILFSTDGTTINYYGKICTVSEGKIWFEYLHPTKFDTPTQVPNRGFKYFDWGKWPW